MQNPPSRQPRRAPVIAGQSPKSRIVYPRPAIPVQIFQEPEYLVEVSAPRYDDGAGILCADEQD